MIPTVKLPFSYCILRTDAQPLAARRRRLPAESIIGASAQYNPRRVFAVDLLQVQRCAVGVQFLIAAEADYGPWLGGVFQLLCHKFGSHRAETVRRCRAEARGRTDMRRN